MSTARQRQRWDDHQVLPHVNWGDLFFDLFYVGAAYNLAVILKESPSWEGFLYFMCCYAPIQSQWNEKLLYDARFAPEDNLFHRTVEVIHLLLLGTAIQHIRPVEQMKDTSTYATTFVFALSLAAMSMMDVKRQHDVQKNVIGGDEAKVHAASDVARKMWAIIPFLLSAAVSGRSYFFPLYEGEKNGEEPEQWGENIAILLCLGGFVSEQVYVLLDTFVWIPNTGRDFKELRVPLNIEFTLHRLGEWVMLMLGESVLALLLVEGSDDRRYYVTFYSGILSVTMMQYLYFRSQPFAADDHAMRRSHVGGYMFYYSIICYSATLIMIGCSFKLILHHYLDEEAVAAGNPMAEGEPDYPLKESARRIANMFSWSMAASFFFLDQMILTHRGWVAYVSRLHNSSDGRVNWPAVSISILALVLLGVTATFSLWITNLELLSIAGCAMVMCQVMIRTRGLRFFPVSKHTMEHAQRWPNVSEPRSVTA
mmetsp:Transcript_944/g.1542  ORF Transcript_944/g.1542 Transcript_944/m.1542 type:complete len:481 (+) Transcript_944:63-1505(+)